jgi:hypothetical protein
MQDLSALAKNSLTVSSMAGGNMMSSNKNAMTAPGSRPVDPLPDRTDQGDPSLDIPAARPVGTAQDRRPASYVPAPAVWKETPDG